LHALQVIEFDRVPEWASRLEPLRLAVERSEVGGVERRGERQGFADLHLIGHLCRDPFSNTVDRVLSANECRRSLAVSRLIGDPRREQENRDACRGQ